MSYARSITLASILVLWMGAFSVRAFQDVPESDPNRAAIEHVARLGILEGYDGRFHAAKLINRYQMAVIGKRIVDLVEFTPPATTPPTVRDVPATHWAMKAILQVLEAGVMRPDAEERFQGQRLVNRYQLAGILGGLLKGMSEAGEQVPTRSGDDSLPSDFSAADPMADELAVREVLAHGLMDRFPGGTFQGQKLVNRGDLAQILDRLLPAHVSAPKAPSAPQPGASSATLVDHARELARLQLELLKLKERVKALEDQGAGKQ